MEYGTCSCLAWPFGGGVIKQTGGVGGAANADENSSVFFSATSPFAFLLLPSPAFFFRSSASFFFRAFSSLI